MLFSGKGRHRGPTKYVRAAALTGVAGAAVAAPLLTATGAQAAPVDTWEKVAQCESSGNWHANTGNGHYGGLQFSASSWSAAGGTEYAPRADQAGKDQQIAVAEKLLKMQGPGAWQCAGAGNLSAGGSSPDVHPDGDRSSGSVSRQAPRHRPQQDQQSQQPSPERKSAPGADYTVRHGDTLAGIAAKHGTSWQKLYAANKSVIGHDADTIVPGQKLRVG